MKLDDLRVYNLAMELGQKCWDNVIKWDYFAKDTVGKQLVKASDSVAANISEGYGRYHYKENIHFNYIARGSLFETKTWIDKASARNLFPEEIVLELKDSINDIARMLNAYISRIGPDVVREIEIAYGEELVNDPFSNDDLQNPGLLTND